MVLCCKKDAPAWNMVQFTLICMAFCGWFQVVMFPKFVHFAIQSATAYVIYYVVLVVGCIPFFYVQLRLGGTMQRGVVAIFGRSIPLLKGAGIGGLIIGSIYLVKSSVSLAYIIYYGITALDIPYAWSSGPVNPLDPFHKEKIFLQNEVRVLSDGIDDPGTIPWKLAVCLVAAWGITWLCIVGGLRYIGYVLSVLGVTALAVVVALLAYGREEFEHSGEPEKDYYRADWDAVGEPTLLDNFTDKWIPLVALVTGSFTIFHGVLPTMGKCMGPSPRITHLTWLPLVLVLAGMPHLFINQLAPYVEALSIKTGYPVSALLYLSSIDTSSPLILLPKLLTDLEIKRGLAFTWYFMYFLFILMQQALFSAAVVDNLTEWLHCDFTKKRMHMRNRSTAFAIISFIFCAVGIALGIPMVTQGGYYVYALVDAWGHRGLGILGIFFFIATVISYAKQRYHICNKVIFIVWYLLTSIFISGCLIYNARFQYEIQDFMAVGRDSTIYVYPTWAYALGWLIALGPIALGLMLGLIHACCTATGPSRVGYVMKGSPGEDYQQHSDDEGSGTPYKEPVDDYVQSDSLRKY